MNRAVPSRRISRIAGLGLALIAWSLPTAAEELGVTPTHVIYPGETINAESLQMARVRKGKPTTTEFAHRTEELVGKIAKRTLLPGRFVPLAAVREAFLVNQGASVQAILVQGGMTISATAILLESGSAGDVVKVRNKDSGAVFSGTVMADGTIRVGAT
jgi:flagella basal body P-ring formation protein FlgA